MRLSRDALSVLVAYPWPGNVRELRNTMERLSLICDGEVIDADDLPSDIRRAASEALCDPAQPREGRDESFTPPSLAQVERRHIERTLEFTSGNKARAARYLGVTVATLYNKLKRYRAHDAGAPGPPVSGSRDDP
jgi:DNA-binding NtrC family response regulator